jgi:phage gp29-like protein
LNDNSPDGLPLISMGWIMHSPGKAKTGNIGRLPLCRVLVWPFLYKSYAVGDLAEFLETYGLPIIVGKYYNGASPEEKASLMRAVTALGHDARAIMPNEMAIEIEKVTSAGDSATHLSMVDWAERAQSKAILGQVLSAEAKATGLGSGVANLQGEVRRDILKADARQIANTLTRDLIYPLVAFNLTGIDGLRRCPRFVFDLGEAEDLKLYAEALPALAQGGARIPVNWVHQKLRIPEAGDDEAVFGTLPAPDTLPDPAAPTAALRAMPPAMEPDTADQMTPALADPADAQVATWLDQIKVMLDQAQSLEELRALLLSCYGDLPADDLVTVMSAALTAIDLRGRAEVMGGR